jgi:TonB family protein
MKLQTLAICLMLTPLSAAAQTLNFRGGGIEDFTDWVQAHLVYPSYDRTEAEEVSFPMVFTVESDGRISYAEYYGDQKALADQPFFVKMMIGEAKRTILTAPNWDVGNDTGTFPRAFAIPVEFSKIENYSNVDDGKNYIRQCAAKLNEWIRAQMEIPEDFEMALVATVEKSGLLSNITVNSTSNEELSGKIAAALENSPKLTPGRKDSVAVRTHIYLPLGMEEELFEVEKMPVFGKKGGLNDFRIWVQSQLVYPEDARRDGIEGKVLLKFVIERDGSLTNLQVLNSPGPALSMEACRVVSRSPKWTPGKQLGKVVPVWYILPIDFVLTQPRPRDIKLPYESNFW